MIFSFQQADANAIDELLWKIYSPDKNILGGGELKQLYKLFRKKTFLNGLKGIYRHHFIKPWGINKSLDIQIGWIDKRPYAKMNGYDSKGEIGDAAIFCFYVDQFKDKIQVRRSSCLLLQSKLAKEARQLLSPRVPINPSSPRPNSSTERELTLLSTWPIFDFFEHSKSSVPVVSQVDVLGRGKHKGTPGHGWFITTPEEYPHKSTDPKLGTFPWKSPWMCGPPDDKAPCEQTLGFLLAHFLSSDKPRVSTEIGVAFDYQVVNRGSTLSGADWSRVCNEMLHALPLECIPPSITGGVHVSKSGSVRLNHFPLFGGIGYLYKRIWSVLTSPFRERMPVMIFVFQAKEELRR